MYYPKSQIKSNLYTTGDEYIIQSSQSPYVGYYYAISTGQYFTGRTPDDRPNQELIKIVSSQQIGLTQNSLDPLKNISTPIFNSPRSQVVDTIVDNNNSNYAGYKMVTANDDVKSINSNNLYELINNELKKEQFIFIDEKLNKNYNNFKKDIFPSYKTIITNFNEYKNEMNFIRFIFI